MSDSDGSLPSLEELEQKISAARHQQETASPSPREPSSSPLRIGTELVSGVIVGGVAGYFLDKFLGSWPILFLICFFLGVAAGGLNIYRMLMQNPKDNV